MESPSIQKPAIYTEEDYYNLPEGFRSELIDGQLYDMAPPSYKHQKILNAINNTIYNYIKSNNGSCEVLPAPFAVKLKEGDKKTIVEPDISVICDPDKLTDQGCTGAPDWIIEIVSPGNSSHDYIDKLSLYKKTGVREYWIVDPLQERVLTYFFAEESFQMVPYTFRDIIKANIFEDLSIDFSKLDI